MPLHAVTDANPSSSDPRDARFASERADMVERQLRLRGIKDERVLAAMGRVPRHLFVPEDLRDASYQDRPLPIGHGQTISQPLMVAVMLEAMKLTGDERVLEVGTGRGYQAALLGELAREVYTVELVESLAEQAEAILAAIGAANVHVVCGDGSVGLPEYAPYDAIVAAAAPHKVPQPLIDQLATGGRLLIPVGGMWGQELLRVTRQEGGKVCTEALGACAFVPLRGKRGTRR